jgi:hypothetical protein
MNFYTSALKEFVLYMTQYKDLIVCVCIRRLYILYLLHMVA